MEEAASNFLQSHLHSFRAPFSAQPAYASDEETEPEIALEQRPLTPDTRHALLRTGLCFLLPCTFTA